MRRAIVSGLLTATLVLVVGAPAVAHNEWEPATAAPGSVIDLALVAADEEPEAGTIRLELQFPHPITVAALPAVPGWTASVVDGEVGGPASGVSWAGGPAPDDLALPITLGPLPDQPGRLQFKTVQTYDNGAVHRWIDDWPAGSPEPENPGPVLDLVAGGPGSIPATTTTAETTTTDAPTTTEAGDDRGESAASDQADDETDDDSDSSLLPIVAVILGGALAAAGGGFALLRARRSSDA